MEYDIILIRYGEMTLKKKNYCQFIQKINENIKRKCSKFTELKYFSTDYRFYIYLNGNRSDEVIKTLDTIPGLASYSLCKQVEPDYDAIANLAIQLLEKELNGSAKKFKVETNRGNKDFKATSIEISQQVARRILPHVAGLSVDVNNPEITLSIDLRAEGTYVFVKTIKGLGGYPSGMGGSGLLMISGGIDSPVAGFLAIKKGVSITAIHYASPPYTSLNSLQKVVDLVQMIAHYTHNGKINLLVVPFTKIQDQIRNSTRSDYLVVLMRRVMYKIADKISKRDEHSIIINGESIGQVASQTLESISVVNEVTNVPIIRPLATFDKEEIVAIARKIGTFETSVKPYEDCCTVFVPEHPVIKPIIKKVLEEESRCNLNQLIDEAIENIEVINLSAHSKYSVFSNDGFSL